MRKFSAPALLLLLCIGFYWKLTLTSQYTFLDSPDLVNLDLPRLQFQVAAWRHAQLPLWNPNHWAGQPFLGQVTGAAYPANWLLAAFPLSQGKLSITTVHWYLVLIHFQAALFCYFLCRDWKRSRAASILGGLVFSLGGFMGTTDWPQILNGALWLPLVILFLFRALRGRRPLASAALSGACAGMMWLSGHHEVPIYSVTVWGALWLAAIGFAPDRTRVVKLAAAAAAAMLLIAAVQIIPALEYAPLVKRWVGVDDPITGTAQIPYSVHQHYSWSPTAVPGIVTPRPPVHVDPFMGIVAFSLALLGVRHGWRRLPQVRLLVLIALAGIFFALAASTFIHGFLYAALPVFGKARVPARALALFSFAVAPLTAYGLDALRRRSSPWLARTVSILAAAGGLLYGATILGVASPDPRVMMTALMALIAAALFAAWRNNAVSLSFVRIALPILVLVELGNVTASELSGRTAKGRPGYLDQLFHHDEVAAFLRAQPQPIRADIADADIPYNFGDWHGISTLGGFVASATSDVLELERHKPLLQDLLGINYYVGKSPPRPDLQHVLASSGGINVYRNPAALPRAWAVHKATQMSSTADIRSRLDDPAFHPRDEALLLAPPPALGDCSSAYDAVRWIHKAHPNPNRVTIEAHMACRGMIIVSDTNYPGWRATVDGQPVPIWAPFGALRGVVVEAGPHHVEFTYLPASVLAGAGCSIAGMFFVVWTVRRSRKSGSA